MNSRIGTKVNKYEDEKNKAREEKKPGKKYREIRGREIRDDDIYMYIHPFAVGRFMMDSVC